MDLTRTKKYTTIHSINNREKTAVIDRFEKGMKVFLDYGCHTGHLSFEMALRFPVTIYAVDNFSGTVDDKLMTSTVSRMTGGSGDFFDIFVRNLEELKSKYALKGEVIPVRASDFFRDHSDLVIDYAFIDASHRAEDAVDFEKISAMVKQGGILAGHDYSGKYMKGVVEAVEVILPDYEWIDKNYTFFLRKKVVLPTAI